MRARFLTRRRRRLLDLRDRLVRVARIGNETPALAIHEQVELLEHGLPDEYLVAQHQGFLERVSALQLDDERFRNAHSLRPPIGVLGCSLTAKSKAQKQGDMLRHDRTHCSGVDECVRLASPDPVRRRSTRP